MAEMIERRARNPCEWLPHIPDSDGNVEELSVRKQRRWYNGIVERPQELDQRGPNRQDTEEETTQGGETKEQYPLEWRRTRAHLMLSSNASPVSRASRTPIISSCTDQTHKARHRQHI